MKAAKHLNKQNKKKKFRLWLDEAIFQVLRFTIGYPILWPIDQIKKKYIKVKTNSHLKNPAKLKLKAFKEMEKRVMQEFRIARNDECSEVLLNSWYSPEDYHGMLAIGDLFGHSFKHKNFYSKLYGESFLKTRDYDQVFNEFADYLRSKYEDLKVSTTMLNMWYRDDIECLTLTLKEDE
jgi:hypothetical protein